ncbi:hypothetical protein FRC11_009326, partial [Ceratobasidium sp. 423]
MSLFSADTPLIPPVSHPFRDVWSVTGRQKDLITCTAISPSGMWLVSCSQDGTVVFVDFKAGLTAGVLDLEGSFFVTAVVWRSDTIIVAGCSNGFVYQIDYEHKSKRPLVMHTLIKSFKFPIRLLAFDTFRDMIAIACGGEVWIYVRSAGTSTSTENWHCVDHVLAPCPGAPSLVTSLCFFGLALSCRHLFIGHAKAGWTVWLAPRSYKRAPYVQNGKVCTIGSAAISSSEGFIAIATLDQLLTTYTLREGGPVIESRFETGFQDSTNYRPVLPIVSTSNDIILKGTSTGDIEVFEPKTRSMASLHHAPKHLIRTLNAYGDKVVVGSSEQNQGGNSCLRCYSFSSATEPQDWRRIDASPAQAFEVKLSSILSLTERMALYDPSKLLLPRFGCFYTLLLGSIGFVGIILALTLESSSKTLAETTELEEYSAKNPTLTMLLTYCAYFIGGRLVVACHRLMELGAISATLLRSLVTLLLKL